MFGRRHRRGGRHMLRAYAVGKKKGGLARSQSDQSKNPLQCIACANRLCATAHRDGLIKVWRGLDDVERVREFARLPHLFTTPLARVGLFFCLFTPGDDAVRW